MPRVHCVSVVLLAACRPGVNHEDTFAFLQQIASSTPFTSDFFCIPVRFCVYFELVCGLETCRMVLLYRSYWKNINTPCLPPKATGAAHGLPRWWEESVRFVYLKALKKIVWFSQGLGSLTFHRKKKKIPPYPRVPDSHSRTWQLQEDEGWENAIPPPSLANKTKLQAIQMLSQDQSSKACELLTHFVYLIVSP